MQSISDAGSGSRRILVSGSSGLIGRRVVAECRAAGDEVFRLVRKAEPAPDAVLWNPGQSPDPASVSGFDVVIHLAGEPVAGRWTAEKKRRITDSRVEGTATLASALATAKHPPAVFLCASGINFYGNTGDTVVDEDSPRGEGFLAEVCKGWEAACVPLERISRVVHVRIGVVLAAEGGTLAMLLPLYRLGLGGTVGGGRGYVSWISLDDLVRGMQYTIESANLRGAVNFVAPDPVTGRELTKAFSKAVGRPAIVPVPAWAMRLVMGEMADETVLGSVRALPKRLLEGGFKFKDAHLGAALAACGIHPR